MALDFFNIALTSLYNVYIMTGLVDEGCFIDQVSKVRINNEKIEIHGLSLKVNWYQLELISDEFRVLFNDYGYGAERGGAN